MKEPLNDWQQLQNEWQSYQPDMQKIQKKINWVTWRMLAILVINVVATLGYCGLLYYIIFVDQQSWIFIGWHILIGMLLPFMVYLDFKIRLPIIRSQGESTRDVLGLYLQRTKAGATLGSISKKFSWLLLILFWILLVVIHLFDPENKKLSVSDSIFGTLWISGSAIASAWYQNSKLKEYAKLKKLWQEYLD